MFDITKRALFDDAVNTGHARAVVEPDAAEFRRRGDGLKMERVTALNLVNVLEYEALGKLI